MTIVLKATREWVDVLDQWRTARGVVLHLGVPSRPACIRYLVTVGMASDARIAELEAEIASLRAGAAAAPVPRVRKGRKAA